MESNKKIIGNYPKLIQLITDKKHASRRQLYFPGLKKNRVDTKYLLEPLLHVSLNQKVELIIEQKQTSSGSFKFQLRCADLCDMPYLRYDSDGPAHFNYDETVPIKYTKVETPHFNSFDNKGLPIAYQTENLKDQKQCEILKSDINFAFAHFCMESFIRYPIDELPTIDTVLPGQIGFTESDDDLLSNIKF